MCVRPSITRLTTPASSSVLRCREIVGFETRKSPLTSATVALPPLSRSTMSRRSGWARALNGSLDILLTILSYQPAKPREEGGRAMPEHKVGTQEEFDAAREELLAEEKELTHRGDELALKRRELPWVPVEKEYSFE